MTTTRRPAQATARANVRPAPSDQSRQTFADPIAHVAQTAPTPRYHARVVRGNSIAGELQSRVVTDAAPEAERVYAASRFDVSDRPPASSRRPSSTARSHTRRRHPAGSAPQPPSAFQRLLPEPVECPSVIQLDHLVRHRSGRCVRARASVEDRRRRLSSRPSITQRVFMGLVAVSASPMQRPAYPRARMRIAAGITGITAVVRRRPAACAGPGSSLVLVAIASFVMHRDQRDRRAPLLSDAQQRRRAAADRSRSRQGRRVAVAPATRMRSRRRPR